MKTIQNNINFKILLQKEILIIFKILINNLINKNTVKLIYDILFI